MEWKGKNRCQIEKKFIRLTSSIKPKYEKNQMFQFDSTRIMAEFM